MAHNDRQMAALKTSEEKYRKMVEGANDAIFGIDPENATILYANQCAEEMCGYPRETLIGMKVWKLHPSDEEPQARRLFEEVVKSGKSYLREQHFVRRDGSRLTVDVSAVLISYGDKKLIQRICRDVTRRRLLEDELRRINENLERTVEERTAELKEKQTQLAQSEKMAALGSLVAGIAHEINTPLGALNSNNDMFIRLIGKLSDVLGEMKACGDLKANPELEKIFENIEKLNDINRTAAERIVKMVNSLRTFARLDKSEKDTVDIHEGIETTLTLVHHELKDRIEVVKNYGDIPKISCYPNQLNQVFMNLVVNACQAIDGKGTVTITTSEKDGNVIVEISDTGKGIPEEDLQKVFDPGFTTKGSGVGTGLGLSIVHQIVQEHQGEIEIDSKTGQGTTFRIILPVA
ncbi:MAG: PAS domain S-box protein [Candidatus Zixiibacteriota bacterium]|nr:MAG: PAS domain S-box protein [candidate division Zixibacteria bacterium]